MEWLLSRQDLFQLRHRPALLQRHRPSVDESDLGVGITADDVLNVPEALLPLRNSLAQPSLARRNACEFLVV
jgi:hypothetical protein